MKLNTIILFLFFLVLLSSCESNEDKIIGIWSVESLSENPISITNYGDITFKAGSRAVFSKDKILEIYLTDTTSIPESYKYDFDSRDLVLMYSDY